jgi:hypothetical protein
MKINEEIMTKTCSKCKEIKSVDEFYKTNGRCKSCLKQYHKQWRADHPGYDKQWRADHPGYNKQRLRQWRADHPGYNKQRCKQWKADNTERYNQYQREWRLRSYKDPVFREIARCRNLTGTAFNGYKEGTKSYKMLGCTHEVFIAHLESQFTGGMTLENKGRGGWHIDHIEPLSNAKTVDEVCQLAHYTNIQPLWETDNWDKGAIFEGQSILEINENK